MRMSDWSSDVCSSDLLAEARRLLSETHKVTVGDDDPILMAVTLHQAFIADFEGLLRRHNDQLALEVDGIMTKATNRVAASANVLRDDLLNTAVKNVIASVAHQAESAGLIKHHMRNQKIGRASCRERVCQYG